MPYIQNTDADRAHMLETIGARSLEELFEDIPKSIRWTGAFDIPEALSELELADAVNRLALKNITSSCRPTFLGAGIYRHFVPELVNHLAGRSEFVTAYTPYQPEASQGALQAFFEYQTMICMLAGLDISNASMYDGATALTESALMAIDLKRKKKIVLSAAVHPEYKQVLRTYLQHAGVEIVEIPAENGVTPVDAALSSLEGAAALVVQSPNFFGCIEDVKSLSAAAEAAGTLCALSVDPISLSVLEAPGKQGVHIVTGEGQALGTPMNFGGPGFGFMAARSEFIRRLPGRIVGQTEDKAGRQAYVLTFQTREQHIRRARATSNICTNHALVALRAVVYLSALGRTGFKTLGKLVAAKSHQAAEMIAAIPGFEAAFGAPFFKEFTIRCPRPAAEVNGILLEKGIVGGYEAGRDFPGSEHHMIFAVTEMTTDYELNLLIDALKGMA